MFAKLFGGTLEIDGAATLAESPEYKIVMRLRNARLERFAALHAPKQRDLRGVVNGSVMLEGKGSTAKGVKGNGRMEITRAALLDMPVMLKMYQGLSFTPPDDYTFKSAELNFVIQNSRFIFKPIALHGDAISFVGEGTADFDSNVKLTFYSFLPRNQIPVPILHELVGEATKGWVRADVTGKLSDPVVNTRASSPIDDALKNLLRAMQQPIFPIGQGMMLRGSERK